MLKKKKKNLKSLSQADSDGSRALSPALGGQEAPPAIPLRSHQQELPTSENNQMCTSVHLRPLGRGAKGAARLGSFPEGCGQCDRETEE